MPNIRLVKQKLGAALHGLAVGEGSVKERLEAAYLVCESLTPDDFPEGDLRHLWIALQGELTARQPKASEGRFKATLSALDQEQASHDVAKLVDLALRAHESMET